MSNSNFTPEQRIELLETQLKAKQNWDGSGGCIGLLFWLVVLYFVFMFFFGGKP